MEASAGVLAVVDEGDLDEHGVLVHAALRLLTTFADDPLCTRAFCQSGNRTLCSANLPTLKVAHYSSDLERQIGRHPSHLH